jgi:OmpA-OmpF porin, OOP family
MVFNSRGIFSPMKFWFLSFILILTFQLSAQTTVQWASKVIKYSTELTELQYSADQILEKPNILPSGGDNPNAWTAYKNNLQEYIKVGFDLPMPIVQVAIAESYNPGAISHVYLYDEKDNEYLVYEKTPGPIREPWRMNNIYFDLTPYNVEAIRIVVDGASVDGFNAIDAIGVSNSREPITAEINLMPNINTKLVVTRLNDYVNSEVREIKPMLTRDKKTIYFSRRGHEDNIGGVDDLEDIWLTDFDNTIDDWGKAKNIGEPLNNIDPNFISSFLLESEELLILGNEYLNGGMRYGISKTRRTSRTSWTYPENLKIFNDLNVHENVNFWLTADSEILLISEEGRGTEGFRDLYVSFLQKDGLWTEPMHMGSSINTAGEEEGPYLMPDKKTLFFTSNGFSGYGKKDVFMTRRLDNTWQSWTEPENLGPILNSEVDDMFLFLPLDGSYGYFCREVEGNDLDIHTFTLPLVTQPIRLVTLCGKIIDPETRQPLDAEVAFSRLRDGVEVGRVRTDLGGDYCIELPADEIYSYRAEIPGFIPVGSTIDLLDVNDLNVYAVTLDKLDLDSAELETGIPISVPDEIVRGVAINLALPPLKRDTFEIYNAQRRELGLPEISRNLVVRSVTAPIIKIQVPVIKAVAGASFNIKNVFFDFDKSLIKERSWLEIRVLAKFMNDYPTAIVELSGHTDNYGTQEYNVALSQRRALAVKKSLETLGIDPERLSIDYFGEEDPRSTNRSRVGRAVNRRVEFTILSM